MLDLPTRQSLCGETMSSLRQILSGHRNVLLLDAASSKIQVACLSALKPWVWAHSHEEAGLGVFASLKQVDVRPQDMDAFIFCEGPGSILGIRTVAAALRAWLALRKVPVWSYKSLKLVQASSAGSWDAVISDARRDSWNFVPADGKCRRVPTASLPRDLKLVIPEGFKTWGKLPEGLSPGSTNYDLASLLPGLIEADLFTESPEPDAFLHEEPSYVTWSPAIHRASS